MIMRLDFTPPYRLWAHREVAGAPYVVCAMFTGDYRDKAERLQASLIPLGLEYAIYEVTAVHRSISERGTDDALFSKPQFINFLLDQFAKPVLYVDADVFFHRAPALLASLNADFAICNWLASDSTDAWVPVPGQNVVSGRPPRYWAFSHAIDDWSETQLICSGCVQWWAPTSPARALLHRWNIALAIYPYAQDDHCLDVAFNFRPPDDLRATWLPKEYARLAFWIFNDPIIGHPELPAPARGDLYTLLEGRTIASQIVVSAGKQVLVLRTMLIDTHDGLLLAPNAADHYVPAAPLDVRLFLPPS
ncbi:MAG TPA: hypothetical protein VGM26_01615 [Rhizomicrobium sp.]|jgi:hypothetical protein